MKVLIVGNGGREHTIAWKLKQSVLVENIYVCPGNAGTGQLATNLDIKVTDFEGITNTVLANGIDMVIIGPEEPLVKGLYDAIKSNAATAHVHVIGPSKHAAQLEGSKAFAKLFMQRHNIPTAGYREFTIENYEEGVAYLKSHTLPIVLKADGLAGGKGVVICENYIQAFAEFEMMIKYSKFGTAGSKVVIEDFLNGMEFSVFAITDGTNYRILPIAKDYKRVGEGDKGLNTGGMGAISPVPFVDQAMMQVVEEEIIKPTIAGFGKDGMTYIGFVFFGLINVNGKPLVIEYNCRLGDPETEVVLPRINNDLGQVFLDLCSGKLNDVNIETSHQHAAAIVATSGGYPTVYETGYIIDGINDVTESNVFIAGAVQNDQEIETSGGRVLVVTSLADTLKEAVNKSKESLTKIDFEDMYFRTDIGYEFN